VDLYCPDIPSPGGFTITSPPSKVAGSPGYIELAVQKSVDGPPAMWLWGPEASLLSTPLKLRIGGSFVYPPPGISPATLRRLIFVAGGVGINPLMSMVSHFAETTDADRTEVTFLYSVRDPGLRAEEDGGGGRDPERVLFLERLATLFGREKVKGHLRLFLTGGGGEKDEGGSGGVVSCNEVDVPFLARRITVADVEEAIGPEKNFAAVYVCGVPAMTDEFVEKLTSASGVGLEPHRVLFEKWW